MALSDLGIDGDVLTARPRNDGATVRDGPTLG